MKRYERKLFFMLLVIFFFIISTSLPLYAASDTEKKETTQPDPPAPTQDTSGTHLNRIDFGNTYIIGQTIKSGAVYLLQRKKSEIKSMLRYREDYRKEILDGFSVDTAKASVTEQKQDRLSKSEHQGGEHPVSQE